MYSDSLAGALELFLPQRPASESEAVFLLQRYLAEREVPMTGIADLRILVETARVFVEPAVDGALQSVLQGATNHDAYTAQLDAAVDAWEHRFTRHVGRGGGRPGHVRLYPKANREHQELLRPLLRVLVAEFPHVRYFWLKTGVSLVVGDRATLMFEELETDGELIVGLAGFNHKITDADILAMVPEEFFGGGRKVVKAGYYAGRRGIHPVSQDDFIHLIRAYDVGLHRKEVE